MRLSHTHALYMATQRLPGALAATIERPSIDACVNAHAGPPDTRRALPSALTLPAAPGRRRAQLQRIASEPSIGGRRSRDAANALKWLRRLENADALAWLLGRAGLTGDALAAYDRTAPVPRWCAAPVRVFVPVDAPPLNLETLKLAMSHYEIPQCETHEISPQPYQRDFLNAMENAPHPLAMVIKPFSTWRYRKG